MTTAWAVGQVALWRTPKPISQRRKSIMLPGMEVDIQFNRMVRRLKPGVIVHVHDIFLPDDYPPHWRVRNYSEQNALMGWLVSGYFDILWPGRYVVTRHG